MKALIVEGGDFAALHFENEFRGQKVSDLIDFINRTQSYCNMIVEAEEINLEVVECGNVSSHFINALRDIEDYDHSKQKTFYMEDEIVE